MKSYKNACPERSRRGFTLVELLIVVLIIGILATIAIVNYNGAQKKAKQSAFLENMNNAVRAAAVCTADGGSLVAYASYSAAAGKVVCDQATSTVTQIVWPTVTVASNGYAYIVNTSTSAITALSTATQLSGYTVNCTTTGCTK